VAITPGGGLDNPLGRALFGSFQKAAASRLDTAGTWELLRRDAGTWQWQTQGRGPLPDVGTLEANGREVLRSQGLGFTEVNEFRGLANQWRTAKGNLAQADPADQIRGESIFTPPWAKTTGGATPSRYRARIEWQAQPLEGAPFSVRGTYEMGSPLTSLADVLNEAQGLAGKKPTSDMPPGSTIVGATDVELEQI
jgi:hypothetical protein